jgi:hypothetical protein
MHRESSCALSKRAAMSAVRLLAEADLVDRSRIIMEKPFGTDLASAMSLNAKLHEVFSEDQIFRIDHFLGCIRRARHLLKPVWKMAGITPETKSHPLNPIGGSGPRAYVRSRSGQDVHCWHVGYAAKMTHALRAVS